MPNPVAVCHWRTFIAACGSEFLLKLLAPPARNFVRLIPRDTVQLQQVFEITFADARALLDCAVKQRLCERRLIGFVVPPTPIAIHVDEYITLKLAAEIKRQSDDLRHSFRGFAVHMKDGHAQHPRDIGRIHRRAPLGRRRGESDLIVDDHMKDAAHPVARQFAHVQRLLNNALAGEGRVAVDEQSQDLATVPVAEAILPCAHAAKDYGIDELKMAWIEAQREMDFAPTARRPIATVAQVILHIAPAQP